MLKQSFYRPCMSIHAYVWLLAVWYNKGDSEVQVNKQLYKNSSRCSQNLEKNLWKLNIESSLDWKVWVVVICWQIHCYRPIRTERNRKKLTSTQTITEFTIIRVDFYFSFERGAIICGKHFLISHNIDKEWHQCMRSHSFSIVLTTCPG